MHGHMSRCCPKLFPASVKLLSQFVVSTFQNHFEPQTGYVKFKINANKVYTTKREHCDMRAPILFSCIGTDLGESHRCQTIHVSLCGVRT